MSYIAFFTYTQISKRHAKEYFVENELEASNESHDIENVGDDT